MIFSVVMLKRLKPQGLRMVVLNGCRSIEIGQEICEFVDVVTFRIFVEISRSIEIGDAFFRGGCNGVE